MATLLKRTATVVLGLAITGEAVLLFSQWLEAKAKVAVAENARERQQAEATRFEESAKVELAAANNATALKKAEADKLSADARASDAVSANAIERQAAEAKIAEAKAAQEYQAAVNAERRAAADADKMDSESRTAIQSANNAAIRSKAEAARALAELSAVQSRLQVGWDYPFNCSRFKTFAECVEGLRRATSNGGWRRP